MRSSASFGSECILKICLGTPPGRLLHWCLKGARGPRAGTSAGLHSFAAEIQNDFGKGVKARINGQGDKALIVVVNGLLVRPAAGMCP